MVGGQLRGRLGALAGTVALALALGACGGSSGSSGVSPAAYAKSICTAVVPFERDVATRSDALNLATIKSAADGKTALEGFLTAIAADTSTAVTQLKAAGVPSVTNGKRIAAGIVSTFSKLDVALNSAAAQAKTLPTSSPQAFKTAAATLGGSVRSSMGNIAGSLSGLNSAQLEAAAKKVPACHTLSG
jgi:hypothetical protein